MQKRVAVSPLPREPFPQGRGRIAIVLDDWGNSLRQIPALSEIRRPLTVAVLPGLPYSERVSQEARRHGHQVLLHMPMEPMNPDEPQEPDTLLTGMSRQQIRDRLDRSFASVPGAAGMNNHQGSRATADPVLMQGVLEELKRRGLVFVDSYTGRSVGPELSRRLGVRFARRDVFLDNDNSPAAIRRQLLELVRVASEQGSAIGIGHDRPATLEVLRQDLPALKKAGYTLVHVSELTER